MENFKICKDDLLTIDQRKKKVIDINQIIMLKGISNYTCFYLKNGTQRLTSHTLKYYESQLNGKVFLRVHRGFSDYFDATNIYVERVAGTSAQAAGLLRRPVRILITYTN